MGGSISTKKDSATQIADIAECGVKSRRDERSSNKGPMTDMTLMASFSRVSFPGQVEKQVVASKLCV